MLRLIDRSLLALALLFLADCTAEPAPIAPQVCIPTTRQA